MIRFRRQRFIEAIYCVFVLGFLVLSGCQEGRKARNLPVEILSPDTHRELETILAERSYDWGNIESGVPPFVLERLPSDLDTVPSVKKKKRLFFLSLLPMVLMANEEVLEERELLQELFSRHETGQALAPAEKSRIETLARDYGMEGDPLADPSVQQELLRRVDIIPPSLVLAQAATESAYGTSRFAQQGNNLFGQWTFIPGMGLVPKGRPEGATYEVRRYPNLYASIQSYLKNLNTHRAYKPLREQRAYMRAAEQPLQGHDLARGLLRYSERREEYVQELRAIIRRNHLARLSKAELRLPEGELQEG